MAAALAACGPGCLMGAMRVAWIAPQGCVYYPVYEAVQIMAREVGFCREVFQ